VDLGAFEVQQNVVPLGRQVDRLLVQPERPERPGATTGAQLLPQIYNPLFGPGGARVNPANASLSALVDGAGNYVPLANLRDYSYVRNYLLSASATNMVYMLSAQMLATQFNVLKGYVNASALVALPLVTSLTDGHRQALTANGFTGSSYTVRQFQSAAVASLASNPNATASGPARLYQEALKNIFEAINKNEPIFIT
jgi:hypothetical protein